MERRPPERVDRRVRGGLGEGDLARGRAGRERIRDLARTLADPGADVGQARPALARADARQRRALEQLELREAARPRLVEVADRHPHASAHDGGRVGGRRRQGVVVSGGADRRDRHGRAGHPGQEVARRPAEIDDDRPGRDRTVRGDDGRDPPGLVALEPHEFAPDRDHRLGQRHAGGAQQLRGPGRQQPIKVIALADGLELRGPGRDDDLLRVDVEHAGRCPSDDGRAGVDGDDLMPLGGIKGQVGVSGTDRDPFRDSHAPPAPGQTARRVAGPACPRPGGAR